MRRLIINADDFGLTPGINRAIAELHDAGALSSATLMATGAAFDDALSIAQSRPTLGIGCHVLLVDGEPVLPPGKIPTLLGADGRSFRQSIVHFFADLYRNRISMDEVEREAFAQIQKLQHAGIKVTHVDTHKHAHMFPRITSAVLNAAARAGVTAIRNPFEDAWSRRLTPAPLLRLAQVTMMGQLRRKFLAQPLLTNGTVQTTSGTIGLTVTGTLNSTTLRRVFAEMPPGTWELVCHPGYNDADLDRIRTRLRESRETERLALLAEIPENFKNPSGVEIINYGKILPGAAQ